MKTRIAVLLCCISVFSFLSFTTIINTHSKINGKTNYKLKAGFAITGDNTKAWSKVDSLEKAGLTRSALDIVEQIYLESLKENNSPQIIKSLIYKLKYVNYTEENSNKKIINQVKESIDSSSFPTKSILQSILADAYWQYYQHNRYRFINRTETVNFNNNDFETWDLARLLEEIINLYQSSLSHKDTLKNIPISDFNDIVIKYKDRTYLRPTLYDFLANRALDFYINEEASVTEPVYKFELKDPDVFSPAGEFVNINFNTRDSMSLKFYAAKILQDLISFHLNDSVKVPLIDIDLKRLNYMKSNSVNEYKDSLYLNALGKIEQKYSEVPFSTLILYNKAQYFFEKGSQFIPGTSAQYKQDKKKAFDICNTAIRKFPGSIGAEACISLKSQILHKDLSFKVEYANLINQPFRSLIQYTNVNKVYIRVIPWNKSQEEKAGKLNGSYLINYFRDQKYLKEWSINLPGEKDYQRHSVEVPIQELKAGYYLILLGTDKNFSYDNNAVASGYTWVTDLSYNYSYKMNDGQIQFLVQNRKSGYPVPDVKVSLFQQKYDGKNSRYVTELIKSGFTNENGLLEFERPSERLYNLQIALEKGNDTFRSKNIYPYYQNQNNRIATKTFFFLDRAIYRPGQTISFKRIND